MARADERFARGYWHWPFLAIAYPVPETIISHDPEYFLFDAQFGGVIRGFHPDAVADYAQCIRNPAVVHAICEDYRAGAGYDRELDDQDASAGRRIGCPTQVLWARDGALAAWYDVLTIWRAWADNVVGKMLDGGHFMSEGNPAETLACIRGFHRNGSRGPLSHVPYSRRLGDDPRSKTGVSH